MKNVIIFGGDGFLGWPLSLRLKKLGHNVLIVDDYSRRWYDKLLGMNSLVPISTPEQRSEASGITFINLAIDIAHHKIKELLQNFKPDAVVHFAQQRSAPISMYSSESRISTINRNNSSTINLLEAIRTFNPEIKFLHMGTMGVYGYSANELVVEGYQEQQTLTPMNPGSVYHLTKCHDQLTFQLYQKLYGLDIIDLHQGVVWGSQTTETLSDPALFNRYDYDSMYGTVFNRFIAQYAKKIPLTIYGTGDQKRAFIHVNDSITSCVNALSMVKNKSSVHIANQFSELLTVRQIADIILSIRKVRKHPGVQHIDNPRIESSSDFKAVNDKWREIFDANPTVMSKHAIIEEFNILKPYISRYDFSLTVPVAKW